MEWRSQRTRRTASSQRQSRVQSSQCWGYHARPSNSCGPLSCQPMAHHPCVPLIRVSRQCEASEGGERGQRTNSFLTRLVALSVVTRDPGHFGMVLLLLLRYGKCEFAGSCLCVFRACIC